LLIFPNRIGTESDCETATSPCFCRRQNNCRLRISDPGRMVPLFARLAVVPH